MGYMISTNSAEYFIAGEPGNILWTKEPAEARRFSSRREAEQVRARYWPHTFRLFPIVRLHAGRP